MELTVPLAEAVAVLGAAGALPPGISGVRGTGTSVTASVAVHELPDVPNAFRAAARMAGPVEARLDDRGVVGRTWTLALRVEHPVLRFDLSGMVADALRTRLAAVPGLARVRTAAGATVIDVDLDAAAALLPGLLPAARGLRARIDHVSVGAQVRLAARVG